MASIPVWVFTLVCMLWLLTGFGLGILFINRSKTSQCWHHEKSTGNSWITGQLIDLGRRKMFTCSQCGKMWFV